MAVDWLQNGLSKRDLQDMEGALDALERAVALSPTNPTAAFAYAQVRFETGRDAVTAFERALALDPANPHLIRTYAAALAAEDDAARAQSILLDTLALHPQWLDGHKSLATLRVAIGARESFDESYQRAIAALPDSLSLRLAHIHLLSTARAWEAARASVEAARQAFGPSRGLEVARVSIESESGGPLSRDPDLFDALADWADPGLDVCRVRHALRLGNPEAALARAKPYLSTPHARLFWPYVSLCWRLLNDPLSDWLDGMTADYVRAIDLGLNATELAELATRLRALHTAQAPYIEQSVKGGTQTDRQLFFRPIPIIQLVRDKIVKAVATYLADLPAPQTGHPLLAPPRDRPILFEGSWSVLLKAGGFHSIHTHPRGWISSALHIDMPSATDAGPAPAGYLQFGEGPPELNLALGVSHQVAPQAGTLVLFPSTHWHRTVPIEAGERLSLAFDIREPA